MLPRQNGQRFHSCYNPTQDVNIRFSYAEGFRAPQAFDEDLHISNVGGELVSIVRAKGLKEERSRSFNASVDLFGGLAKDRPANR